MTMEAETDLEMLDEMNVISIENLENLCCEDEEDGDEAADQPNNQLPSQHSSYHPLQPEKSYLCIELEDKKKPSTTG